MKILKKLYWINIILLIHSAFYIRSMDDLITSYVFIGGWQVISMLVHTRAIYGEQFKDYFEAKPVNTFLMDGSYTKVSWPVML